MINNTYFQSFDRLNVDFWFFVIFLVLYNLNIRSLVTYLISWLNGTNQAFKLFKNSSRCLNILFTCQEFFRETFICGFSWYPFPYSNLNLIFLFIRNTLLAEIYLYSTIVLAFKPQMVFLFGLLIVQSLLLIVSGDLPQKKVYAG